MCTQVTHGVELTPASVGAAAAAFTPAPVVLQDPDLLSQPMPLMITRIKDGVVKVAPRIGGSNDEIELVATTRPMADDIYSRPAVGADE
jgi:hypothetical protein